MKYKKIIGTQGSWTVKVTWEDGTEQELPTAHLRFLNWERGEYHRDGHDLSSMQGHPGKYAPYCAALQQTRKVVITRDDWHGESCTRTGYIDVWDIEDLRLEDSQLSFTLTERLRKVNPGWAV